MDDLRFYQITDLHHYALELGTEGKAFEKICLSDQKCLKETGAMIDAYFDKIIETFQNFTCVARTSYV